VCPDLHTLSAYLDGEVAVRWAQEIEQHLAQCGTCRTQLQRLTEVKETLSRAETPDHSLPKQRVWTRIQLDQEAPTYSAAPFMKRRVNVPLPLAAAMVTVLLVMGFALAFFSARANVGTMKITKQPSGTTEVLLQTSIKEIQQILGSLESPSVQFGGEVVIPLPEDAAFIMTGEPILTRDRIQGWR